MCDFVLGEGKCLVLRTCASNMSSQNGFIWPESGEVEAPDWEPFPMCGNGLHGLLWGEGDGELLSWDPAAKWLVVEVEETEIIHLNGKVKFPRGNVVCCGDRVSATKFMHTYGIANAAICGMCQDYGSNSIATAGDYSSIRAGDGGRVVAGRHSTIESGNGSGVKTGRDSIVITGGDSVVKTGGGSTVDTGGDSVVTTGRDSIVTTANDSMVDTGDRSIVDTGRDSIVNTGRDSMVKAGDEAGVVAGEEAIIESGIRSIIEAGDWSVVRAGRDSMVRAGKGSVIIIRYWDKGGKVAVAIVGENGIEPDTWYKFDPKIGHFCETAY